MELFKLQFKRFIKNKVLLILAAIFVLVSIVSMLLQLIGESSSLRLLSQSLLMSYPLAILCMFISFEFLVKAKTNNAYEYLVSLKSAVPSYYISGIAVLASIIMVYGIIAFLANVIFYMATSIVYTEYIIHIFTNILLNLFLIPLTFILIGAALTFVKKRMTGYALIIFICLLTSPVLTVIGTQLHSDAGVNIFKIVDLFDFMPPLLNWTPIYSFGYSILPYRFFKAGFFSFLAITVIIRFIYKNYRLSSKIATPVSLCVSVLMLVLYLQPVSTVTLGLNPYNGCHADQHYYKDISEAKEQKPSDFNVISYKLNLSVRSELTAIAEIEVSRTDLSDFQFTLHHGYIITMITNENGEKLQFTQMNDHVTVYSDKDTQKLIMYYKGSAPRFFANSQGISLPGYFPFYPQKGFRNIYNKDEYGFDKFTQTDTYSFDVSVDSKKKVYCNLAKTGDNTFSGISNSLTLVSGLYDSYIHNNIEIVYPYMLIDKGAAADESFTMDKMLSEADKFLTNRLDGKDIKRIICVANMNNASPFERLCVYSDHITVIALNSLDYYYENQRFSGDKRRLYEYINTYQNARQAYNTRLNMAKSEKSESAKLIVLLDEKIKLLGEDLVIEKAAQYFNSEDNIGAFEFLESLR